MRRHDKEIQISQQEEHRELILLPHSTKTKEQPVNDQAMYFNRKQFLQVYVSGYQGLWSHIRESRDLTEVLNTLRDEQTMDYGTDLPHGKSSL